MMMFYLLVDRRKLAKVVPPRQPTLPLLPNAFTQRVVVPPSQPTLPLMIPTPFAQSGHGQSITAGAAPAANLPSRYTFSPVFFSI